MTDNTYTELCYDGVNRPLVNPTRTTKKEHDARSHD